MVSFFRNFVSIYYEQRDHKNCHNFFSIWNYYKPKILGIFYRPFCRFFVSLRISGKQTNSKLAIIAKCQKWAHFYEAMLIIFGVRAKSDMRARIDSEYQLSTSLSVFHNYMMSWDYEFNICIFEIFTCSKIWAYFIVFLQKISKIDDF